MKYSEKSVAAIGVGTVVLCLLLVWGLPFGGELTTANDRTSSVRFTGGENDGVPLERFLTISRVLGDENTFGALFEIQVTDDSVLVIDRGPLSGEGMLLVVNLATGTVEHMAATKGEGPGEILDSVSIDVLPGEPERISVYDYQNRRITIFGLSPWLDEPIGYFVREDGASASNAHWLDESRVVMNGRFQDHLLRFYEAEDDGTLKFVHQSGAPLLPDSPATAQRVLNWGHLAVRPDRKKLALAFFLTNRLHIYDSLGALIREITVPIDVEVSFLANGRVDPRGEYACQDVAASMKHIYALFSGRSDDRKQYIDTVHVFSWDGDLVELLRLERPVFLLAVSPDEHHLVGVTDEPFPQIVVYDLSRP